MNAKKSPVRKTKIATARRPSGTDRPTQVTKRRILVVDDHPITREGLAANINRQADLEVCGQASSAAEAMSALSRLKPDLIVTDFAMPGRSGLEFIQDVNALMPELPTLMLSMHDESIYTERALRAGARGYLMKDAGAAKVLEVIRVILSGQTYVSPQMSARFLDLITGRRPRGSDSPIEKLSNREFEVFRQLGQGKSSKEVAEALNISPKTVEAHRSHIREKLQISDAPSLIHYAVRWLEAQGSRA